MVQVILKLNHDLDLAIGACLSEVSAPAFVAALPMKKERKQEKEEFTKNWQVLILPSNQEKTKLCTRAKKTKSIEENRQQVYI